VNRRRGRRSVLRSTTVEIVSTFRRLSTKGVYADTEILSTADQYVASPLDSRMAGPSICPRDGHDERLPTSIITYHLAMTDSNTLLTVVDVAAGLLIAVG
jgi:hypothetical protein